MTILFRKTGRAIQSFGMKAGRAIQTMGRKAQESGFFRKAANTLHPINEVLGMASNFLPILNPVHTAGKMLEGAASSLNKINFVGQPHTMHARPVYPQLERPR